MPESYIEIINKVKSGDSSAFRIIADELKDKAYALTVRILKNKEDAEDSLQESFFKFQPTMRKENLKKDQNSRHIFTA